VLVLIGRLAYYRRSDATETRGGPRRLLLATALTLVVIAVLPAACANAFYPFTTSWGRSGAGDGVFNWPNGVAVDSSGNVYVTDLNNRIQKFTPVVQDTSITSGRSGATAHASPRLTFSGSTAEATPAILTFTVDTAAPTTTDSVDAAWHNAPVTVTLSATDSGGSGVEATHYTTGTSPDDPTTASSVYDPANQPTLGDGELIKYFSTDGAGNAENIKSSLPAKVDTAAPSSSASAPAFTSSGPITVTYTASDPDPTSGLAVALLARAPGESTYSRVDADTAPGPSGSFAYVPAAGAGTYLFVTRARDATGNLESWPTSADARTIVDTTAPETTIFVGPSGPTKDPTPTFRFASSEWGSSFDCSLDSDSGPWTPCSSPMTSETLADGPHTLYVRAIDRAGNADPDPAQRSFLVDTHAPSSSASAPAYSSSGPITVTYTASDPNPGSGLAEVDLYARAPGQSAFSRVAADTAPGPSGSFADVPAAGAGTYIFATRARDRVGNREPWPPSAVARTIVDTTAPETTISAGPSGPTNNNAPSFAFSSSEARSTFECRLDSDVWQSCSSPKSYSNLPHTSHTFEVAATDLAGNTDPTPASRSFSVRPFSDESEPNVLLVITDDQPIDTMQVMPNTRRFFEAGGVTFAQGYDVEPLCCPSRASIFSGLYPHNHGITINDGTNFDASKTWQRHLWENGYYTGIIGKYLNKVLNSTAPYFDFHKALRPDDTEEPWTGEAAAEQFLQTSEGEDGRPWALVYAPNSPHNPWTVMPRDPEPIPPYSPPPSLNEEDLSDKDPRVAYVAPRWDPAKTDEMRTGIMHELQATDEALGTLFDKLNALGEDENTLAVFISDNGWLWGQHSLRAKAWPYLESVKVPLFLRWPGHAPAGVVSHDLVANIDIAPTIYAAAGITPDYPVDGHPLLGFSPRSWLLLESPTSVGEVPPWSSYVTPDRQYIHWTDDGFVEDYDLRSDPWEIQASNVLSPEIESTLAAARTCVGNQCP
jgi:arylsulfatase A-like enzyme